MRSRDMVDRIHALEEEVAELHFHPIQTEHPLVADDVAEAFGLFWSLHVCPVITHSKRLAIAHNADIKIVWLSAVLHDIARIDGAESHDEKGSEKAYRMLLERGWSEKIAQRVRGTILTHRCKEHEPTTLEGKILATADAVAHFKAPFYFWFSKVSNVSMEEQFKTGMKKIRHDYSKKIFFTSERESVKKEYELLRKWFSWDNRCKVII